MTKDFEKAVLWKRRAAFLFSRLALSVIRFAHDGSPKGRASGEEENFLVLPKPLTLGEVDATSGSRRRGRGRRPFFKKLPHSF